MAGTFGNAKWFSRKSVKGIVKENNFKISNSGNPLTILPEKLFERFSKNDPTTTSLGLGLSIVKKIRCTLLYTWVLPIWKYVPSIPRKGFITLTVTTIPILPSI